MPDPQEIMAALQRKVQELSDSLENLSFSFWKKTGPASSGISSTDLESTNFATGVAGWRLDADGNLEANNGNFRGDITGASGTFTGTVTVGSLNIPDSTTTPSFHVKSDGTVFGGANVAGEASAIWNITPAGVATFKNILIGGTNIQYQVTNAGIFSFGDGSDGAAVMDGSATPTGTTKSGSDYTLTRDVYWTNATMSTGTTLNPAGYRIFGTGTLTMNGTAIIKRNGNAGADASGANLGAGGAALADGYLKGSAAGGNGGDGGNKTGVSEAPTNGVNGANTTNSIGSVGHAGGDGGKGNGGAGSSPGTGGTAGTAAASNVSLIANWHLATLLDVGSTGSTVKFDNSGGAGGGGGGGRDAAGNPSKGGGGGGGGSAGGIVAIYFRSIVIGASASITANGGAGGKGADGTTSGGNSGGGGGGGGGGNGGQVILVYNVISNSGTLTASAGAAGTFGAAGGGTAAVGVAGTIGVAGTVRQFLISM